MAFLPQKFRGAQERARGFFPPNHIAPLVIELRQVTIGLNNVFIMLAKQGFRCRPHDQPLRQRSLSSDCNNGTFRRKALHMILFFLQKAFRDKHRHIDVFVSKLFESFIKIMLDVFPDCVAVRTDHHTSLHARIIGQFRFFHHIGIPLGKIHIHGCNLFYHFFIVLFLLLCCHIL